MVTVGELRRRHTGSGEVESTGEGIRMDPKTEVVFDKRRFYRLGVCRVRDRYRRSNE